MESSEMAAAAKKEIESKGEIGIKKVAKKKPTRPISPKLTKPSLPPMPEPEPVHHHFTAHEVPGWLNATTMEKLTKDEQERRQKVNESTLSKYRPTLLYRLHKTKGGRPIDDVAREVEERFTKELRFDSSYYNPPPDFSKATAPVRINASTIYREDAMYRKQQAKDAQILKNYEEELRDPIEYYMWQTDMKEMDQEEKLKLVVLRREQAKRSAIEAKEATLRQRQDNVTVADIIRHHGEVIKEKKQVEREIDILQKQSIAQSIAVVRDTRPKEEMQRVVEERLEAAKKAREEMERARQLKEAQDQRETDVQADRIRQLRALNTVHKKIIKVFDPTQSSGVGILDEISYMEMKERTQQDKLKLKEEEEYRRKEILEAKQKREFDLNRRATSMVQARQVRADANQEYYHLKRETARLQEERLAKAREEAAVVVERELSLKRAAAKIEKDKLRAEQEMIIKKQQFLGTAVNQIEEMREEQMNMARDRQERTMMQVEREVERLDYETRVKERKNKVVESQHARHELEQATKEREDLFAYERKLAVAKIKDGVIVKKEMFKTGKEQFDRTKTVKITHNPYAERMNVESLTKAGSKKYTSGLQ